MVAGRQSDRQRLWVGLLVSAYKTELIHTRSWPTKASARRATFDYIERWYNLRRIHSSLGYRSPAAYEATLNQDAAAQAA